MGRGVVALIAALAAIGCGGPAPAPSAEAGKSAEAAKGTVTSGKRGLTEAGKAAESRVGSGINR